MYIAYGSALYSNKGSTNLHIDMSDAVNYLVYVGFPTDGNAEENAKEVFKVHIFLKKIYECCTPVVNKIFYIKNGGGA